ncbi:unnamed protein product [Closterium sp. NIES-53]
MQRTASTAAFPTSAPPQRWATGCCRGCSPPAVKQTPTSSTGTWSISATATGLPLLAMLTSRSETMRASLRSTCAVAASLN